MWKIDFDLVLEIQMLHTISKVKENLIILLQGNLMGGGETHFHFWVHVTLKPIMRELPHYNHFFLLHSCLRSMLLG